MPSGQKSLFRISPFSRWHSVTAAGINVLTHKNINFQDIMYSMKNLMFPAMRRSRVESGGYWFQISAFRFLLPKANSCSFPSPFTLHLSPCRRQTLHASKRLFYSSCHPVMFLPVGVIYTGDNDAVF